MSVSSSNRKVSSALAASVKKRPTLYISENDPRAKDKTFINSYQGLVQILPMDEYLSWLKKQIPGQAFDDIIGNDESNSDSAFGSLNATLPPPTSLKYDATIPENTKWVVADGQVYIDIVVDFTEALGFENDPNVEYHAHFVPENISSTTPNVTPGAAQTSTATVAGLAKVSKANKLIVVKWKELANATSYTIQVESLAKLKELPGTTTGNISQAIGHYTINSNLAGIAGAVRGTTRSNGYINFHLNQPSGGAKNFSGTYIFTVKAIYSDKTTSNSGVLNVS